MRDQNEFLKELEEELKYLKSKEQYDVIKIYRDKISIALDYGETEEKVLARLPEPSQIAQDIYDAKGSNFLKKRKQQQKIGLNLKSITNIIAILIIIALFVLICVAAINIIVNITKLYRHLPSLDRSFDRIVTFILVSGYIGIIVLTALYLIDLFYIMIMMFLNPVISFYFQGREINDRFLDFTLTGFISKKLKVKGLPIKVIAVFASIVLIFGITSYIEKGYIYRSIQDIPQKEYLDTIGEEIKTIKIIGGNIYIKIITDENTNKIVLKEGYEFERKITREITDSEMTIRIASSVKYDPLLILKEPTPQLYIYIPKDYQLDNLRVDVLSGYLALEDITVTASTSLAINNGQVTIANCSFNEFTLMSLDIDLAAKNNQYQKGTINIDQGIYKSEAESAEDYTIENGSASLYINKLNANNFVLKNYSGTLVLDRISGNHFRFESSTSMNVLTEVFYNKMEIVLEYSCSLEMRRSVINDLNGNISNSKLTMVYFKAERITIEGSNSSIYFNDVNYNYSDTTLSKLEEDALVYYTRYNSASFFTEFSITGKTIDTYLLRVEINNLTINQENGLYDAGLVDASSKIDATFNRTVVTISDMYAPEVHFNLTRSDIIYNNSIEMNILFIVKKDILTSISTNLKAVNE